MMEDMKWRIGLVLGGFMVVGSTTLSYFLVYQASKLFRALVWSCYHIKMDLCIYLIHYKTFACTYIKIVLIIPWILLIHISWLTTFLVYVGTRQPKE